MGFFVLHSRWLAFACFLHGIRRDWAELISLVVSTVNDRRCRCWLLTGVASGNDVSNEQIADVLVQRISLGFDDHEKSAP